ncbi:hypothetical protein J1605_021474 [Eschrichtius robustus]|uniref:PX domain-containing protein n=1 Tax=Eschrichtius robustus TaxID=9764 RepID=A0AB34HC52_ESCRO|nr:hypothetical protein J1605_021474 [Eschrichtius robustus]
MAPLPGGAGVGVTRQVFTMWPPARSMSITSDLVENALASVGGARLAPSGYSLISPLQDPAALGNARGGANVGARPAGTRRRGRRRRGLWSERGEFGCQRRVDAGSSHPVGGARGRGDPAEPRERPHGRFVPLRAEGGRVAGSRSCCTHPPGLTRTRLPSRARQVFRVEVLCHGRRHTVQRRYSEFHALHKRIKKLSKVPDFPSKRLPNWRTRGLEQRRQSLEAYIQGVLYLNQDVPKELLEFLSLRHLPIVPKASSWGSQLYHQPVISFCMDPYICIPSPEPLPNVVVNGVLQGLYGFSASTAKAQPEAACHPAPVPPMP